MAFPGITTTQQFTVTAATTDRKGRPAPVEPGTGVWASSDESVASVVPSEPEGTALVVAQGVGEAVISFAADADLGEGVTTIVGQETVTVSIGGATSVGFTVGEVEEQP